MTEAAFTVLARMRSARPFHPRGISFTATWEPRPGQPLAFLGTQPRPALIRLSHAAGLPARWPDVFGLAVRILDGAGPGRHQDLLLSTAGEPPLLRHVLAPARGVDTRRFSSLLPYHHNGRTLLLGARARDRQPRPVRLADLTDAATAGRLVFTLAVAAPFGPWQPIADLRVDEQLSPSESEQLRFHPWNSAPQLRPAGLVNSLRAPAYEAAQRSATSQ